MMVQLECFYCGKKWKKYIYNQNELLGEKCDRCKDSRLKATSLESKKIDTYKQYKPKKGK